MKGSAPIPEIRETVQELKVLMRKCNNPRQERRIRMLWLFKTGQAETRKEAAKQLPARNNTVGTWLKIYDSDGVEGLMLIPTAPPPPTGRALVLPDDVHKALKQRLDAPEQGFAGYEQARRWLASEFGEEHSWWRIRAYLQRHFKAKIKTARPSHEKKTPKRSSVFLKS